MTDKFTNISSELDMNAMETNKVKTRKQARDLSLKKWKAIRKMAGIFFNEFDTRCGFCGYGENRAKERSEKAGHFIGRCASCGVSTICDKMLEIKTDLEVKTLEIVGELISHFENMKVAER